MSVPLENVVNINYRAARKKANVGQTTSQTQDTLPSLEQLTGGEYEKLRYNFRLQVLREKLDLMFQESKVSDWEGDNAEPISDAAYFNAANLLPTIPLNLPIPEILPDNDGYIEFEWSNAEKNFSLYVTDTNLVLYAGFYGKDNRLSGRFKFENIFPSHAKHLAKDVYKDKTS